MAGVAVVEPGLDEGDAGQFFPRDASRNFEPEEIPADTVSMKFVGLARVSSVNVEPPIRDGRPETCDRLRNIRQRSRRFRKSRERDRKKRCQRNPERAEEFHGVRWREALCRFRGGRPECWTEISPARDRFRGGCKPNRLKEFHGMRSG